MAGRVFLLCLMLLLVSMATIHAVIFEPCNICRSPNVVRNKNGPINVLYLTILSFGGIRTCGDLDLVASTGWISDSACVRLQTRRSIREACDCGQTSPTQSSSRPSPTISSQTIAPSPNLMIESPSPNLMTESPSPILITEAPIQVKTSAPIETMMMMRKL